MSTRKMTLRQALAFSKSEIAAYATAWTTILDADGWFNLTDASKAPALRGIHFGIVMRACEEMATAGILKHRVEPGFGDFYQLAA